MGFLQAATELSAAGTWQDSDRVSHDHRAENVILEVEYGEIREEWIGDGIVTPSASSTTSKSTSKSSTPA